MSEKHTVNMGDLIKDMHGETLQANGGPVLLSKQVATEIGNQPANEVSYRHYRCGRDLGETGQCEVDEEGLNELIEFVKNNKTMTALVAGNALEKLYAAKNANPS